METTSKLITGFVAVLIGLVLLTQIAVSEQTVTQTKGIVGEEHALTLTGYPAINTTATYTVTNAPTGWKVTDCPLTNFAIKNQSGSALTLTDDYTVTLSTGVYLLKNTVNTNTTSKLYGPYNKTYVTYNYCGDNYINSSWGRTSLDLAPGLFALALMGVGIALFYRVYQDWKK